MLRVVLDSNGVDKFVVLHGAFEVVERAVKAGDLELLGTHVLEDELEATPDPHRRATLQTVLGLTRDVPTAAFIFDVSKFDRACLGGDQAALDTLRSHNPGPTHVNDGLIAITAHTEGCALVTDERRLRNRAREVGITVLTPEELLAKLGWHAPGSA